MEKVYSEKGIEEAIRQSPGEYKRFGISKSGNLKIYTDRGMYVFKCEDGKMVLASNNNLPSSMDDAACEHFKSAFREEIKNWDIEVVNVEPVYDEWCFCCTFKVQLLKETRTLNMKTGMFKQIKKAQIKQEVIRLIKELLIKAVPIEKWISIVFEETLIEKIKRIQSTDLYADHVCRFIQCIKNDSASEITYEKKENVLKVTFGNVVTAMHADDIPVIRNQDVYQNVIREIELAQEYPDIFQETNDIKKLFKKYSCKIEDKINMRDMIRKHKDEFHYNVSVKEGLFKYQKSILIGIDYEAKCLTKSIDEIEEILKEWISVKDSLQQKEIEKWKAEGLADNILIDAIISILSQNENITMNKLLPLLKGNKVQTLTPIKKTEGMGMFPKLPDEIIEQTVRKLKEKDFLFEKYHKGEYTTYFTFHFKDTYLKIVQDPVNKKTEDLPAWIHRENRIDGSYEWLEYLKYLNEQQDHAFDTWIPLLDILEKPVVCCYASDEIQNAIQKAPEEIKEYFKNAAYERYASFIKQALR